MKNKHLYWILVILWSLPLLLFMFFGFFIDLFVNEVAEDMDWLYYLYQAVAVIFLGNAIFILLASFLYNTAFHIILIVFFSVGIVAYIGLIYAYTIHVRSGIDVVVIIILSLFLHLFIINTSMKNLTQIRYDKGLKPLNFL